MSLSLSTMVSMVFEIITPASSSSVMLTVLMAWLPAVTPVGRVPKASRTDSPSSSMSSPFAVKVKVFTVSPLLKVTSAGTE